MKEAVTLLRGLLQILELLNLYNILFSTFRKPKEYEEIFPRLLEIEGNDDQRAENQGERQLNKLESVKKFCVAVKRLSLYKALFLARHWTTCSLFYLNKEYEIVEIEEIEVRSKKKLPH